MKTKTLPNELRIQSDRRVTPDRRFSRVGGRRRTDVRRWATNADLFAASMGVLLPWRGPGRHGATAFDATN